MDSSSCSSSDSDSDNDEGFVRRGLPAPQPTDNETSAKGLSLVDDTESGLIIQPPPEIEGTKSTNF